MRGRSLAELLQADGPFSALDAVQIGIELCRGLAAVHRLGLTHGDVKAENVLRDVTGRIVYELTGSACEGYAQNMRYVTQTMNQDGAAQTTDLRTSSWEAVPPLKLRFSSSTYQNEQPADQTRKRFLSARAMASAGSARVASRSNGWRSRKK